MKTVYALTPITEKAQKWISKNVQTEPYQWLGNSLVIEHRYITDIVAGMKRAHLKMNADFRVE